MNCDKNYKMNSKTINFPLPVFKIKQPTIDQFTIVSEIELEEFTDEQYISYKKNEELFSFLYPERYSNMVEIEEISQDTIALEYKYENDN